MKLYSWLRALLIFMVMSAVLMNIIPPRYVLIRRVSEMLWQVIMSGHWWKMIRGESGLLP